MNLDRVAGGGLGVLSGRMEEGKRCCCGCLRREFSYISSLSELTGEYRI
jgi:hypothetical protein